MTNYKGLTKKDLVEILVADRNHHFNHPQQVNRQVLIAVGTGSVGLLTANSLVEGLTAIHAWIPFCVSLGVIVVGLVFLLVGQHQHNDHHVGQRQRLEDLLEEVMHCDDFHECMDRQSAQQLPLLVAEPDRRVGFENHDGKTLVGVALVVLAVVGYLLAVSLMIGLAE